MDQNSTTPQKDTSYMGELFNKNLEALERYQKTAIAEMQDSFKHHLKKYLCYNLNKLGYKVIPDVSFYTFINHNITKRQEADYICFYINYKSRENIGKLVGKYRYITKKDYIINSQTNIVSEITEKLTIQFVDIFNSKP